MRESTLVAVRDLGFSDLEARVYVALLEHGPQSGYGVAKTIAKPGANTYTAIESLERRGAAVGSDGNPRVFRAVEPDDVLAGLQRTQARRHEKAKRALAKLGARTGDEGIYRVLQPDLVLDRARSMLRSARRAALVDAFPLALDEIAAELRAAIARGVSVLVKAYAPVALDVTRLVVSPNGAKVIAQYAGGQWLNVTVDGEQALTAFFDDGLEHVRQGTWTPSPHLAFTYHSALASEIVLAALAERAATRPDLPLAEALAEANDLLLDKARAYRDERGAAGAAR